MNKIEAFNRSTKTKGQLNILRHKGEVPGIIYGGKEENQKISILKKEVKNLLQKDNFLSNVISLKLEPIFKFYCCIIFHGMAHMDVWNF